MPLTKPTYEPTYEPTSSTSSTSADLSKRHEISHASTEDENDDDDEDDESEDDLGPAEGKEKLIKSTRGKMIAVVLSLERATETKPLSLADISGKKNFHIFHL